MILDSAGCFDSFVSAGAASAGAAVTIGLDAGDSRGFLVGDGPANIQSLSIDSPGSTLITIQIGFARLHCTALRGCSGLPAVQN